MTLDSDDEWLQELLAPERPPKRRRISEDDIDAARFLDELLSSHRRVSSGSLVPPSSVCAALPAAQFLRPTAPAVLSGPLQARLAPSTKQLPPRSALAASPRANIQEVSRDLPAGGARAAPKIEFRLARSKNAGAVLAHASQVVRDVIGQGPTIFKIGITADPDYRWRNAKYGYQRDRDAYQQMLVFSEADSAGAAMLEASLISMFRNTSGCRNAAPGGESVRHGCVIFTYIVFRHLDTARSGPGMTRAGA